ncbi:unnamed protein product [Discosporangium mesarthrocarpum]
MSDESDGQNEKLAHFIGVTGATEEVAKYWMEANSYHVEGAVNMFLEHESSSGAMPNGDGGPRDGGRETGGDGGGGGLGSSSGSSSNG